MFLLKESMEIYMYPVILRLTNSLRKGSMKVSVYPVTSRLIQKFVTERVHGNFHVSFDIKFKLKKGPWKSCCNCNSNVFFLAMIHGYVHVRTIRRIKKLLTKRIHGNFPVPVTAA